MMDQTTPTPQMRDFIGKPKTATEAAMEKSDAPPPLISTLPKEPEELSKEELLESYKKLALRCFQSENALDMAKELIKSLEEVHVKQLVVINKLEEDIAKSKNVLQNLSLGVR